MSGSLCGSSNALSSLQKHTEKDRSLQLHQAQIQSGHPIQTFRSARIPPGQSIDREFENFSAPHGYSSSFIQHPQFEDPLIAGTWVSDFERQQSGSHSTFSPTQLRKTSGWQIGYTPQRTVTSDAQAVLPQLSQHTITPREHISNSCFYSLPSTGRTSYLGGIRLDEGAFEGAFEDAFEDAFEQAASEMNKLAVDSPENIVTAEKDTQALPEERTQRHLSQVETDELAQTAGKLLESVRENSSHKFKNSNFLALMRKLRDREVLVHGDNIVQK